MRISESELRGRVVISSDGQAIGKVSGLFLDSDSWRVDALEIKLRKGVANKLGAEHGVFHSGTIEAPVSMVQSVGDAVVLSAATSELRDVVPGASGAAR
jgi:sporulation protein YlmC with PRC-barrel domain